MKAANSNRAIGVWVISAVAILFGLLTLKSGGMVLFVDGPDRVAAGNYVPFVLLCSCRGGLVASETLGCVASRGYCYNNTDNIRTVWDAYS